MIEIEKLKDKDIGRWVTYTDGFKIQKGRIKHWNDNFIFVVFNCNNEWDTFQDYTGQACSPDTVSYRKDPSAESNKEIIKAYIKLCKEFGVEPYALLKADPYDSIQQHWSMLDNFVDELSNILQGAE